MVNDLEEPGKKNKLLLIGGGGHCKSVLDSAIASAKFDEIGIIDTADISCLGISVVGTDNDIPALMREGWNCAVVTVGSIGDTSIRRRLFKMIERLGLRIPSIIDPTAIIAGETVIEPGCFIGKKAIINTGSKIGKSSIINSGSIVEHDCVIDEFVHVSPGTTLCGQVIVGSDSHIGAGSVIKQGVTIGNRTLIGAGSVVVNDIPSNVKAYGNPCRVVE